MSKKIAIPLVLILLLLGLLAWMLVGWNPAPKQSATHQTLKLEQPPKGGDFTLNSDVGLVSLTDFRGKVVLIYFGYTFCPDVCPLNLSYMVQALDKLTPEEREQVQVLFISVDPERDKPENLGKYARYFAPDLLGLTGTPEQLAEVAALYGAVYRRVEDKDSAMSYLIDHSSYTYLVDKNGKFRQSLDHATPPDRIVAAIRSQLAEGKNQ